MMRNSKFKNLFNTSSCILAMYGLMAASTVSAQNEPGVLQLEEILVTAQKREENLNEVPISIATFGAEALKQSGIKELSDIGEYIPNLEFSGGDGGTITIRGVGSSSRNIGFDSRVGVYVDGVYMGQSPAANQDILDLERVEVLRGPQGTLFGKNAVAGAINLISKKPSEEFTAEGTIGLGNSSARRYTAMIDMPISDSVFTKISVNKQTRDGFVTNVPTGDDLGEQNGLSFRLQLRALLTDNLEMNFTTDSLSTDIDDNDGQIIGSSDGLFLPNIMPFDSFNNVTPHQERNIKGSALTFDWELDNEFSVKSITAYRTTEYSRLGDLDGGYAYAADPGLEFLFGITSETELDFTDEYKQLTQELQLVSPSGNDLEYVLGLYLYDQTGTTIRDAIGHNDPDHPFYAGAILPFPGDRFKVLSTSGSVDTSSYAAFVNGTYVLSDRLTLGFGARYSEEKKEVSYVSDISGNSSDLLGVGLSGLGGAIFGFADGTLDDSRTDSNVSPEISLRYAINNNLNTYYRAASGFKSGGYNLDFITQAAFDAGLEFDKETVFSHEIGLKGDLLNRRITFAMSVFMADYEDYQIQQFVEDPNSVAVVASIRNAAEVRSTGFELEVEALIVEGLKVTSSLGYLNVEFTDFPGGDTDSISGEPINLKGNTVGGAPEESFNLGVQYYLPVEKFNAEALFRIDYAYTGKRYSDGNHKNEDSRTLDDGTVLNDFLYSNSQESINARVGLYAADGGWEASLWVRNLTDENNTVSGFAVLGGVQRFDTLPRTYGLDITSRF